MSTKPKFDPRVFQTPPVIKKAPDHKTIYANMVRTAVTPFDIRIMFGQVGEPIPDDPAQQAEEFAAVIMAPEEAKAIIPLIQHAIQIYEAQYGAIRDVTSTLEKMKAEALAQIETPAKSESSRKQKRN